MKRFARAFAVTLGLVILVSAVSLVPQKNATGAGSAPVTIVNTALPVTGTIAAQQSGNWNVGIAGTSTVGVNNFPGTLTGATVPVSGSVTANVSLPNPLPVQSVKQSAANFKTLQFNGTNYVEVLPDGTVSTSAFTIPQGEQFVITDVSWVAFCFQISIPACSASAGDAVVVELGNGSYLSEATYSSRLGSLFAGHSDHLTSGIVALQLPLAAILSGGPGEQVQVILQGYLVP